MSTQTEHGKKSNDRLVILALLFIVPILAIVLLLRSLSPGDTDPQLMTEEAIASRIAPMAQYNTGAPAPVLASDAKREPYTGEQLYNKLCMSCHDAGLLDAPKLGDNAAWGPRIAAGEADVYNKAINGFNAMPARGGDATLSDLEVKRAVAFMVNKSGGNFAEPTEGGDAAPAAEAAPAEAPAAEAPAAETAPAQTATEAAVEATKEAVAETAAKVEEVATEAATAASNATEAAVEATKEVAADAVTAVSNATEAAVEATKEAAADTATAVSNATEASVEKSKEVAADTAKAVEKAADATVETAKEVTADAAKAVENVTAPAAPAEVPLNKQGGATDSTEVAPVAQ